MLYDSLNLLRFVKYKFMYNRSIVGYGTYIDKHCNLSGNVQISKWCSILHSTLDCNVIIKKNCNISESNINSNVQIYNNTSLWDVSVGSYSYISPLSVIGKTTIGRFCSIGSRFQCTVGNHPSNFISTSPVFFSSLKQCGITFSKNHYFNERQGIKIGNDVWVGSCVFIKDGTTIENGAIVAAGAVVVDDIPAFAIVGGVPAKLIRYRFSKKIREKLCDIKWWDWPEAELKKAQPSFCEEDINEFVNMVAEKQASGCG